MPYTYAKQGSKYTVYKKKKGGERGEKVGSTEGTKEALKKYLAALHASETTNENLTNLANKIERFFKPKDKNIKFKEDLKDLYYTNRPQYDKVKDYYMNQIDSGRQSVDIQAVMDAFNEIERGLNEATSEEDKAVFDAIKTAGFKSWDYEDPKSGEVFYAKGRDKGEAARYLRYKYKLEKIDVSKITPTGLGAGITDNALVAIYTNKDINENKNKMKVNQLRQIIREEISKVLNEQTDRIGWNKGSGTSIEFNNKLADELNQYVKTGTITKAQLKQAVDKVGSRGYDEWDAIIGSKSEDPYTIKMFNGNIQISGTKARDISKNMQSSFDKYGTNLGGK